MSTPVFLVKGDDAILVADEVRRIVDELVGDGDRSLLVDELDEERYLAGDGAHISPLVDAAQTPPFLTDRRIVVGRHLARFTTAESVAPLVAYLDDPLPTTSLVLVWDKGPKFTGRAAVPKSLNDALKRAGATVVATDVPANAKGRDAWLKEHLHASPVHLDARAQKVLAERLGEDLNRVGAILGVLESTYGPGAKVGVAELEPFVGEAGGVPPWELTDAISAGDIATALDRLRRMIEGGDRHALQIMATLHRHVAGLMKLDGSGVRSRDEAAKLLGMAPFPAEKLMRLARTLGSDRIRQQVLLLAEADLDLRGAKEWDDELVLEVLVARLARLSSTR
ncbi:DNA polymerase III subunit delta [Actinomarinicola tropica]|uniref:DNA polymerase III subunit delta n=1 Tax=Actinomarinicola tropica TaxID=2789776 RepID=A0A5Q2RIP9_9ACTN|nr:DNA polymerase III subunit delta [Actinomarinicola tropica]QGG95673.1 DNA polymerase III subunit delta [Actinomarinicola tropica]